MYIYMNTHSCSLRVLDTVTEHPPALVEKIDVTLYTLIKTQREFSYGVKIECVHIKRFYIVHIMSLVVVMIHNIPCLIMPCDT